MIEPVSMPVELLKRNVSEVLTELEYSPNTINDILWFVGSIERYMRKNGLSEYSESVGEQWLEYKRSKGLSASTYAGYSSAVNRINDVLNGKFQKRHIKTVFRVPVQYENIYNKYIEHCIRRKLADGTVENRKRYASCFFNSLYSFGISSIDEIRNSAKLT